MNGDHDVRPGTDHLSLRTYRANVVLQYWEDHYWWGFASAALMAAGIVMGSYGGPVGSALGLVFGIGSSIVGTKARIKVERRS